VADLYASDTDARVTILNPLGSAVADSATSFDAVPNQLDQTEVQAALNGLAQRAIRAELSTGEATLYVATPIHQGDRLLGLVQMSRPMRLVMARTSSLLLSLAALSALALLVATALAIGLARRLVRPVQTLERAALAIAAGDLSQRVPVETADELGRWRGRSTRCWGAPSHSGTAAPLCRQRQPRAAHPRDEYQTPQ